MSKQTPQRQSSSHQCGVIAVVIQHDRFLVIKRSRFVRAPGKICFPGGEIEEGETEHVAVIREMHEELQAQVTPVKRVWTNSTKTGIKLFWWKTELISQSLTPNPDEVESSAWMTCDQILACSDLLETNHEFLMAWQRNEIAI